uniref:Uncharacterized protein n=1 Tax=Amorphochlora amoebiformis TaxID=1561963 RepID=A0A7S0DC83_9EUKA|mmetsp:Transcript_23630/g.37144  ORF Transcript_23630/g.37144 Transcript_23630/m.37144 type:complete len:1704 (+) Transcript_23630:502-5613(+)
MLLGQLSKKYDQREREAILKVQARPRKKTKKRKRIRKPDPIRKYPFWVGHINLEAIRDTGIPGAAGESPSRIPRDGIGVEVRFEKNMVSAWKSDHVVKAVEEHGPEAKDQTGGKSLVGYIIGDDSAHGTILGGLKTVIRLKIASISTTFCALQDSQYLRHYVRIDVYLYDGAFSKPHRSRPARVALASVFRAVSRQRKLDAKEEPGSLFEDESSSSSVRTVGTVHCLNDDTRPVISTKSNMPKKEKRASKASKNVRLDVSGLYEALRPVKWSTEAPNPHELKSELLPYQRKALAWMIHRETDVKSRRLPNELWINLKAPKISELPANAPEDSKPTAICFSRWLGLLYSTQPKIPTIPDMKGGILAEEMGLGKTVEMISLVLRNPMPAIPPLPTEKEIIGEMETGSRLRVAVGATLVVTPSSILFQWVNEIKRHAPDLKVVIYEGMRDESGRRRKKHSDDHIHHFARADIVLTTYRVLASEVHYGKKNPYGFRRRKRYKIPTTPLLTARFWRMVLDEAQEVESTVKACAQMAGRIASINRWCMTGTPVGKRGLEDLYGLALFLKVSPFDDISCWRGGLEEPYFDGDSEPLLNLMKVLLWRHSKRHISGELKLPPLTERVIRLRFSPVEEEYYDRVLNRVRNKVFMKVREGKMWDRDAIKQLEPLRLACCNPAFSGKQTRVMNLSTFGHLMCAEVRNELTAAERELCRSLNLLGAMNECIPEPNTALTLFEDAWTIADLGVAGLGEKADSLQPKIGRGIITKNEEVRQWNQIEMITAHCFTRNFCRKMLDAAARDIGKGSYIIAFRSECGIFGPFEIPEDISAMLRGDLRPPKISPKKKSRKGAQTGSVEEDVVETEAIKKKRGVLEQVLKMCDRLKVRRRWVREIVDTFKSRLVFDSENIGEIQVDRMYLREDCTGIDGQCIDDEVEYLFRERKMIIGVNRVLLIAVDDAVRPVLLDLQEEPWRAVGIGKEEYFRNRKPEVKQNRDAFERWNEMKRKKIEDLLELPLLAVQNQVKLMEEYRIQLLPEYLRTGVIPEVRTLAERFVPDQIATSSKPVDLTGEIDGGRKEGKREEGKREKKEGNQEGPAPARLHLFERLSGKQRGKIMKDLEGIEEKMIKERAILSRRTRVFVAYEDRARIQELLAIRAKNPQVDALKAKVCHEIRVSYPKWAQKLQPLREKLKALDEYMSILPTKLTYKDSKIWAIEKEFLLNDRKINHSIDASSSSRGKDLDLQVLSALDTQYQFQPTFSVEVVLTKIFKRLQRQCRMFIQKVDTEYQSVDFTNKLEHEVCRSRWGLITDSLSALRIVKLLVTTEEDRLRKAQSVHTRALNKLKSMCEENEGTPGMYWDPVKFKKLEKDVKTHREKCQRLNSKLTYMSNRFGVSMQTGENKAKVAAIDDKKTPLAESSVECPICRHEMKNAAFTRCGHQFCFDCIKNCLKRKQRCPTCRQKARIEGLTIVQSEDEDTKAPKDTKKKNGLNVVPIKGEGDYGTKVETLLRLLIGIEEQNPGAKSLVFSHFPRSLDMVAEALRKNSITFEHLKGATARKRSTYVERFKSNPKTRVMLLSLRSDSSGLTLVAATHVFLLEPSLNFAVEQQAINRVHRIGQNHPCSVHRLVIRGSIEQKIFDTASRRYRSPGLVSPKKLKTARGGKLEADGMGKDMDLEVEGDAEDEDAEGAALAKQQKETLAVSELLTVLGIDPGEE